MYEDEPTPIGPLPPSPAEQAAPIPPSASDSALPPPLPEMGQRVPSGMILYPRRTIYIQGLLLLLLAAVAFAGGYLIGRGGPRSERKISREKVNRERVLVEGRLSYETGDGRVAADSGAVIVALPGERLPERTLSIDGLRPRDPAATQDSESVRAIDDLGGVYARADDSGAFRVVLPEEGRYRVLLISRRTTRDGETNIDELELSEIRKYFHRAGDLIGRYKYDWDFKEIKAGCRPIEHNFGRDGED